MGADVGSAHLGRASHAHRGEPTTVADSKNLGANVRDLNRSSPITVKGDGGAVEERIVLGADFEESALYHVFIGDRMELSQIVSNYGVKDSNTRH